MTPERALLGRTVERLEAEAAMDTMDDWYCKGQRDQASDLLAWLTAEMAKLETET